MAVQVKLDAFMSSEPEPEWLNQLKVTIAMGKRYEQKGDIEKSANCYETVLYYDPKDTKTRIRLSKCYQKMLQPEKAVKHQSYAMKKDPHLFETIENEANVNFELGNFENSLITYYEFTNKWKTSYTCHQGYLKSNEVIENSLPVNGIISCLGATMLEMIENGKQFNHSTECQTSDNSTSLNKQRKTQIIQSQEAYYLRNMVNNVEFYKKQLKNLPKFNNNNKLVCEQVQNIVLIYEKLKNDLFEQKPFYLVTNRQTDKYQFKDRKQDKDMIKLQVAKYINMTVRHCLAGEIGPAQRQAELIIKYMNKQRYTPMGIVNTLHEVLGLTLYLVNQDVPKWSKELNHKRMMFILGSKTDKNDAYNNAYQESYFGTCSCNLSDTVKKLTDQLKETEFSIYSLYLQYKRIICSFKLNKFKTTRKLSKKMFTGACTLGSIAWQVNALMMAVISESRIGDPKKCMKTLEFVILLSRTLGNVNVTHFLRTMWKLFAENRVQVRKTSTDEKRKVQLVKMMVDSDTALATSNLLRRIDKLPAEFRMPLLPSKPPEFSCARPVARRDPLITGDQAKRLGMLTPAK